jgi:hypothetical protein
VVATDEVVALAAIVVLDLDLSYPRRDGRAIGESSRTYVVPSAFVHPPGVPQTDEEPWFLGAGAGVGSGCCRRRGSSFTSESRHARRARSTEKYARESEAVGHGAQDGGGKRGRRIEDAGEKLHRRRLVVVIARGSRGPSC